MAITGETDPFLRPFIRLTLRGPEGRERTIDARFDTGFDGTLAVPPEILFSLGLARTGVQRMTIADGSVVMFDEYRVRVLWEGFERPVRVLAKPGDCLVGVGLFEGYRVCIDFLDGGKLTAEFLP